MYIVHVLYMYINYVIDARYSKMANNYVTNNIPYNAHPYKDIDHTVCTIFHFMYTYI